MAKDKREHVMMVCSRNWRHQLLHQPQPYGPKAGADEVQPKAASSHRAQRKASQVRRRILMAPGSR